MGAKANQGKVELMVKFGEYFRRVGAVKNFFELERLGLTGHDFSGCSDPRLLPALLRFTKENPKFHIVSSVGKDRFVNRKSEDAYGYILAKVDRDPALELNFLLSCKRRGFCPSCCAKRMAEAATHLTQNVLPLVPYRQFVVSFPIPLRYWLHTNKRFASEVFGLVTKEIHRYYLAKANAAGITHATPGTICFTQRWGSALN